MYACDVVLDTFCSTGTSCAVGHGACWIVVVHAVLRCLRGWVRLLSDVVGGCLNVLLHEVAMVAVHAVYRRGSLWAGQWRGRHAGGRNWGLP